MLTFTENENKEYEYWSNNLETANYTYRWRIFEKTLGVWALEQQRMLHILGGIWYCRAAGTFDRQWKAVAAAQQEAEDVLIEPKPETKVEGLSDLTFRPAPTTVITIKVETHTQETPEHDTSETPDS